MYRLQLIWKSLVGLCILVIAGWSLQFRVVHDKSPDLRLAPFGFSYNEKPFSGFVYGLHPDLMPARFTWVTDGKWDGVDLQWYPNFQRSIERHYSNGQEVGTHKAWYQSGKVRSLKVFDQGLPHGRFYDWHPNGQLAQFVVYERGQEIAAKSWTAGGKPFYNYVWKDQKSIGLRGDTYCSPRKKL